MAHFYGSHLVLGSFKLALLWAMFLLTGNLQAVLKFEFTIPLSWLFFVAEAFSHNGKYISLSLI